MLSDIEIAQSCAMKHIREIAEAAKEQLGFELDKKKIQMDGPIKELGTTTVTVKLHPQVAASLKVNVKEA